MWIHSNVTASSLSYQTFQSPDRCCVTLRAPQVRSQDSIKFHQRVHFLDKCFVHFSQLLYAKTTFGECTECVDFNPEPRIRNIRAKRRTSDVLAQYDFSPFSTTIETTLTLLLFSLSSLFTFLNCSLSAQVSSLCLIYYQDQQVWNLWNPLIEKPLKAARMKRKALSFQLHIHVELFK